MVSLKPFSLTLLVCLANSSAFHVASPIISVKKSTSFDSSAVTTAFAVGGTGEDTFAETDEGVIAYFEDLDRAVECATNFGLCNVQTLYSLADKVDAGADSCFFENEHDFWLCEKEIADRHDVAEVLRLQAELQLRMEAVEMSSLFANDVKEEHNRRAREDMIDILSEDGM